MPVSIHGFVPEWGIFTPAPGKIARAGCRRATDRSKVKQAPFQAASHLGFFLHFARASITINPDGPFSDPDIADRFVRKVVGRLHEHRKALAAWLKGTHGLGEGGFGVWTWQKGNPSSAPGS
jgi:hypothetical protein